MSMTMTIFAVEDDELARLVTAPADVEALFRRAPTTILSLDKAWAGLHYVLTGTAWDGAGPAAFLLHGGDHLGTVERGLSIPRAIRVASLPAIAAALSSLPPERFEKRLASAPADDVYGMSGELEEDREWLTGELDRLRAFVDEAIAARQGLVVTTA